MVSVSMSATFEGKPLDVLTRLVAERQRILGESAKDGCIATGMNALIALRAATRVAPRRVPKSDVRFGMSEPKYIHGTRGKSAGKLLRRVVVRRYRDGKLQNLVRWQPVEGEAANRRAQAKDLSAAWKRFGAIANRGLAKHALGAALQSLGSRTAASAVANPRISRLAAANVGVSQIDTGRTFTLEVRDSLKYAKAALKGGPAAYETALMKAANRTAGRLRDIAARKFGETIPTPFPEVAGRRVR